MTPESSLLSPSTTHISENQFEIASSTTCVTLTPEEQKLTLAATNLQFHPDETELIETSENTTSTETKDILHHDVTPESSLLSPSTTHISENQFEIASSTTCVTLTPEEQKLTLAATNLQFHPDDKSVTATGERFVKETCLIGQETSTLTPELHEAGLTETSEKIASGITCATLTSEEQKPTLAETNMEFNQSETSVTTLSSYITDKGSEKETCLFGQDTTTLTPVGHETELTETNENATPTETKDILHHDVPPESSLLSSSTTHISGNQFEIASSTTCVTLTPEEQKLTLAATNLQFHPDDKSVTATSSCVLGERFVKETCLIGQETSTLTPELHEAGLTETSEKLQVV